MGLLPLQCTLLLHLFMPLYLHSHFSALLYLYIYISADKWQSSGHFWSTWVEYRYNMTQLQTKAPVIWLLALCIEALKSMTLLLHFFFRLIHTSYGLGWNLTFTMLSPKRSSRGKQATTLESSRFPWNIDVPWNIVEYGGMLWNRGFRPIFSYCSITLLEYLNL